MKPLALSRTLGLCTLAVGTLGLLSASAAEIPHTQTDSALVAPASSSPSSLYQMMGSPDRTAAKAVASRFLNTYMQRASKYADVATVFDRDIIQGLDKTLVRSRDLGLRRYLGADSLHQQPSREDTPTLICTFMVLSPQLLGFASAEDMAVARAHVGKLINAPEFQQAYPGAAHYISIQSGIDIDNPANIGAGTLSGIGL